MLQVVLRAFGVGDGVIAIAFFLLFSLLICYCGASTERAGTWCVVSVLLSATVVLLLLLAPKESAAEVEDTAKSYTPRVVTLVVLCVGLASVLLALLALVALKPIQGHRVRLEY